MGVPEDPWVQGAAGCVRPAPCCSCGALCSSIPWKGRLWGKGECQLPGASLADWQNQARTKALQGLPDGVPASGWGQGCEPTLGVLSSEGPGPGLPGCLPSPRSGKDCSLSSESSFLWPPARLPPWDCPSRADSSALGRVLCRLVQSSDFFVSQGKGQAREGRYLKSQDHLGFRFLSVLLFLASLFFFSFLFFFWQKFFFHLSCRSTIFLLKYIGASSWKEHPPSSNFPEMGWEVDGREPLCSRGGRLMQAGVWTADGVVWSLFPPLHP